MKTRLTMFLVFTLLIFSCKKEEQSCSDGIFTPEKEVKTDCGGVCPPCDFVPTVVDTYLSAKINGELISFSDYSLSKAPEWILTFQNDSLYFNVNFGDGDSLGGRPIISNYSFGTINGVNYPDLQNGTVVLAEIDNTENYLSGFFTLNFNKNGSVIDTLAVTDAQFSKINW
ncbi:hypothetical protein ERX46_13170 [Brumimicrobium glaciale]|uniref:Lipoprotein n=1 Tax=Brumimicrobium glaciale TaxID=200475 RepID=A0A4V1WFF3_9FLAO|nr:hypothetical protein [Brumimicrobium glaciale]RYM32996.1 hypothetical protein ERX46_13170 [Brumimicrobium glaciale]